MASSSRDYVATAALGCPSGRRSEVLTTGSSLNGYFEPSPGADLRCPNSLDTYVKRALHLQKSSILDSEIPDGRQRQTLPERIRQLHGRLLNYGPSLSLAAQRPRAHAPGIRHRLPAH